MGDSFPRLVSRSFRNDTINYDENQAHEPTSVGRYTRQKSSRITTLKHHELISSLCTSGATLAKLLDGRPNAPALSVTGGRPTLTRGALKQVVTSLSSEFARAGCGHGDIVAIVLDNSVAFVASFLALVSIGAVVAPVSTDLTISEYTYSLTNIKPRLVILSKDAAESAAAAAVRNVGMESAFIFEDEGGNVLLNAPKGGLLAGSLKIFRKKVVPEDFAVVLQHTEGTSASSPYAYLLTHSNILAGAAAITDGFQLTAEDKTLVSMPMCHTQGLLYSLVPALATGGEVVIPAEGKFSAALFWSNIQDQGVSYAIMVPTAVALLLRHKTAYEAAGRPALRFIAASCGAGLMPAGTREEVENEFGVPVLDSLGIPESCSFVACNTLFCDSPEVGTFGRPCRGIEVSVRNSQGAEVSGTGEMGSVLVRGAAVSTAHLQEGKIISPPPEMANGWLNLHRQGYIDTRGTLTVSTDSKLINQAGNKLEPCEAEAALEGLAGAERIAVFAVEHALMGQVVGVALLLDGPDEVITNEEVCMYATASQHPLPARWLPACTVLVPLIQDWPSSAPTSDLAQAFGLPVLSGRSNATFIYTASNGLSRQDQASSAAAAGSAGGVSFMRRASTKVLKSSTSFFLAKERQLLLDLESSVIYSYATVLNVNIEDLESESNFFDYGASLQILALLAEIKRRTGISLSQSDAFIRPTIAQLAACLLSKKQEALEGSASGGKSDPPPVVPVSQRLGWQPASYGQEQMCLANEQSGAGAAYNMPYCVKLSGILNVPALHAAVLSTIRAEEGLRSLGRLNFEAMQAEQRVVLESESESCLDFVEHSARNPEEALEIVEREQAYLFDLEHGPIVRVNLIKISPKMHYVLINFHHLNIDGWSQALHRHLVLEAYVAHATAAALGQPPPPLPPAHSITYLDFSVWQRKWLGEQGAAEHQIEYWKKELADAPMLDMPFDRPRTALVSENGGKVDIRIPAGIVTEWRKLLASNGCTLFMGALSIFHVLLHRWSGQSDIIVGAATANRTAHPDLASMMGQFANELAIRCDLQGRPTYSDILERIRKKVLAAWAAQDVPFHEVVAALELPRVAGTTPIFQSFFALQETSWHVIDVDTTVADGLQADILRIETKRSKFSVHLMLRERPDGGLDGDLLYPTDLWDHSTVERMARHYEVLAASAIERPNDLPVGALQMLAPREQHVVQVEWNNTAPSSPFPKVHRIEAQILAAGARNPCAIALETTSGRTMTYGELIEQSSAMAANLGVKPGETVALAFRGEIEMVVGVLAALLAGATYVPVDVEHTPIARMQVMLEDSKAQVFLLMDRYKHLETDLQAMERPMKFIYYQDLQKTPPPAPLAPSLATTLSPDALAGLFYTSGSTGPPKGVMISHSNIHNLVHWWARLMELGASDKCLLFSSYSFIMSLRQMIPTLCVGATLVLPDSSVEFGDAISHCGVTKIALTPSALATIDAEATLSLKRVQVAGEAPTLALAKQWAARLDAFYIGLGPTELCAHACTGLFPKEEKNPVITIGFPVTNSAVYIVNEEGQLQPAGVVGELWVAGENVAMGYLNRPDLNAHSFITNPFDPVKSRLYRTGDFARRLPDGRVKFEGRRDAQVKIRGFRVEMREIVEVILDTTPKLQRAEVMLLGTELIAFVTPTLTEDEHATLRQRLQRQLQDYMIPTRIIDLSAFPLNKNGKLDRQALIQIGQEAPAAGTKGSGSAATGGASPTTPMQMLVQTIWGDVVGKPADQLDLSSNFFEIGGTSLYGILTMRRIGAVLNCHVPATLAFSAQTLGEQAAALETIAGIDSGGKIEVFDDVEAAKSGEINTEKLPSSVDIFANIQGHPLPRPLFTVLQLLGILLVVAAGAGPAGGAIALCLYLILEAVGFPAIPLLPFVWMAATIVHLLGVLCLKYVVLGGKLRPGVYHIYSVIFLKWWLLRKLQNVTRVWLWYVNQTPFVTAAYRLLGANIGPRVTLDEAILEDLDLVTIENDTFLQSFASVVPGEIFENALVLRPVQVGPHSKLEPRATVLGGGTVASGCIIRPWSAVISTSPVKEGAVLQGSPAESAGHGHNAKSASPQHVPGYTHSFTYVLGQLLGVYVLVLVNVAGFASTVAVAVTIADKVGGFESGVYCFTAFFLLLFLVVIVLTIALKWIVLGRVTPGRHDGAWYCLRVWLVDRLLMSPILRMALHVWAQEGTIYPYYLRSLGAKVGSHVWWNRPWVRSGVDLLTIGDNIHGGMMELILTATPDAQGLDFQPVEIGNECTLGQRVVVMPGVKLGTRVTVGAEGSIYPGVEISDGSTVFGSPPTVFASSATDEDLVRQMQTEVNAEEGRDGTEVKLKINDKAHTPRLMLFASMVAHIAFVPAIGAIYGLFYYLIVWLPLRNTIAAAPGWLALLVPAVYCAGTLFLALLLAVFARVGIADFRTGSTAFYTWRFFAWCIIACANDICSGVLMYPIAGTWLFSSWLRLVGAGVGKKTFVAPHGGGFREINHMDIGDGALVLTQGVQGHFLDHNALQFAPCNVGDHVRLNCGATVMPLCSVGVGSTVRAVATTIKGQKLNGGMVYLGSPAAANTAF